MKMENMSIREAMMDDCHSIAALEIVLREAGVTTIVITTGNYRSGAHAFYEKFGYEPTGRRYKKSIRSWRKRGDT